MADKTKNSNNRQFIVSVIFVFVSILCAISASIWLWQLSQQQEQKLIQNTAVAKSELIRHQFLNSLPSILKALERMRNRWIARQGPPFEEWKLDAQNYVNDNAGLRAVEWVNKQYIVKWVVPLRGNEAAVDLNLTFEKHRKEALDKARLTNTHTISKPIDLVQGGKGFLAYFPIVYDDKFEGFILGVFGIEEMMESLLPTKLTDNFNIRVYSNEALMFEKAQHNVPYNEKTGARTHFIQYGVAWELLVWPKSNTAFAENSIIPTASLILAISISALAGLSLFFALRYSYSERSLRIKEAEHRATLNNAIDGIITIDTQGVIRTINDAVLVIFGYQREELIGENIKILMPEPYQSEHDDYLLNFLSTREAKIIGKGRRVEGKRMSGEIFPMDLGVSSFHINDREYFCGVIRDITLQLTLEQEKEKLITDLKRSNEELDSFAYIASHDLKEPLRAIQNHAQFLLEDYTSLLDEEGIYKLNRLVYLSGRMEQLISELMYYSRLGREKHAYVEVNMNDLVSQVLNRLNEAIVAQHVTVTLNTLPTIYGDKVRLEELFYNLITNAYKYNTSSNKQIHIGFDEYTKNGAFFVKDNGIGIHEQFKTDVYRIFKRLNSSKKFGEGTGAGLTFAKKIVEQHHGEIWFESELNKGTCFYFTVNKERQ